MKTAAPIERLIGLEVMPLDIHAHPFEIAIKLPPTRMHTGPCTLFGQRCRFSIHRAILNGEPEKARARVSINTVRSLAGKSRLLLQRGAVPNTRIRCRFVGTLQKIEQDGIGRIWLPHFVVRKNKFVQSRAIKRSVWFHFGGGKAARFRVGVGIENWFRHCRTSRPKTATAYFVRISFARYGVGQMRHAAGMLRSAATREASDRQVEAAPE